MKLSVLTFILFAIVVMGCSDDCKKRRPLTGGCLDIYAPVCGCDGKTYSNGCYAEQEGVKEYTEGECP